MTSLGSLCVLINFRGPWYICLSSSILRMVSSILQKATALVFISLIKYLLLSLVSSSFLVFLKFSFLLLIVPRTCSFLLFFCPSAQIFFWFGGSVSSIASLFKLFIMNLAHISMPNSILISSLHILIVCIRVSLWHYEGDAPSRRSFCLFWRETKQSLSSRFWRDRKWARESEWELEEGTHRRQLAKGDAEGQSTTDSRETSRHEIGSKSSEGRPVKMSQHSSWLCGNYAKDARQR